MGQLQQTEAPALPQGKSFGPGLCAKKTGKRADLCMRGGEAIKEFRCWVSGKMEEAYTGGSDRPKDA